MPIISAFFGIVIRIHYDDHNPPHLHAEYQGFRCMFDFNGNIFNGSLRSRTATRLVREWIDLHNEELEADWQLACQGMSVNTIAPLE